MIRPTRRFLSALSATEDMLSDNGVRSQSSPDLMEIWNAKQ